LVAEPAVYDLQSPRLDGADHQRPLQTEVADALLELVDPMSIAIQGRPRLDESTDLDLDGAHG
jgi:hypothetical protein